MKQHTQQRASGGAKGSRSSKPAATAYRSEQNSAREGNARENQAMGQSIAIALQFTEEPQGRLPRIQRPVCNRPDSPSQALQSSPLPPFFILLIASTQCLLKFFCVVR